MFTGMIILQLSVSIKHTQIITYTYLCVYDCLILQPVLDRTTSHLFSQLSWWDIVITSII